MTLVLQTGSLLDLGGFLNECNGITLNDPPGQFLKTCNGLP